MSSIDIKFNLLKVVIALKDLGGCDRMKVEFTTTHASSAYYH